MQERGRVGGDGVVLKRGPKWRVEKPKEKAGLSGNEAEGCKGQSLGEELAEYGEAAVKEQG